MLRPILPGIVVGGLLVAAGITAVAADPVPAAETAAEEKSKPGDRPTVEFPPPRIFPEPTAAERRIAEALAKPITVNWADAQLGDVVAELEDKFGIPIELDMAALTADGRGAETLVSVSLEGVTLKSLLRSTLDPYRLTYVVRGDVLLITTLDAAEKYTRTRVYQVHDLVVQAGDLTAGYPDFNKLIEVVTSTVAAETWREFGGTQGEIKDFYGPGVIALIITQTDEVHEQIESLLAALRGAGVKSIRDAQAWRPNLPRPPGGPFVGGHGKMYSLEDDTVARPADGGDRVRPPEASDAFKKLVQGNTRLACDLYRQIAEKRPTENIVFSPYGVSQTMGLLELGARNQTAEEIARALHVPSDPTMHEQMYRLNAWINANRGVRGHRLSSRTHLFTQFDQPFPASFLGDAIQFYDARITPLDFRAGTEAAKRRVVEAARRDAEGFLDPAGIADDIDENTKLALLNTVYFRGKWARPFEPSATYRQLFHSLSGDLRVELMFSLSKLGYAEAGDLQIVRKEYASAEGVERAAFYIVLPPERRGALSDCEEGLSPEKITEWIAGIHERTVELHLPKFTFEAGYDLKPLLESLGVRQAFEGSPEGTSADFSGIDPAKRMYLQGVRQKAKIEVNERETEAAATTAAGGLGGASQRVDIPPVVRCDRPFLFFIRDEETGTILFLGRVAAPDNDPKAALSPLRAPGVPRALQGGGMF